jgi:pimeloyl-ACP methyl ester carboxylesterase
MTAFTVEPVELVAVDGVTLRGQRWAGADAWVILLHDRGEDEDLDRWGPLAPALAARDWTVLTVDLRGHGASDGDWDQALADEDVVALIEYARERGAAFVAVIAAGASAISALRGVEQGRPGALVLLSPRLEPEQSPAKLRGAGEAKLILVGGGDETARADSERLAKAAIGWVLHVSLPTVDQGTTMLEGAAGRHLREQVIAFLAERRFLANPRPIQRPPVSPGQLDASKAPSSTTSERSSSA